MVIPPPGTREQIAPMQVFYPLVTGWQLLEVKYAPFIQAVPGIPRVIFRLKKDGKEANILQFLREQGKNLAQQGVRFWIGTE